jgi:hypothetical protein
MYGSSDDILEKVRSREVTGVFHSRKALEAAVQDLLVAGYDRGDIDVSASPDEVQRRVNYQSIPPADLADIPIAPRQPFVGEDDVLITDTVVGSVVGCAAALAIVYMVTRNIGPLSVIILGAVCGFAAGGAAVYWARRRLRRERARGLEKLSEAQGLLIWVRVGSPEKEAEAQEILIRHGGQAVHVHEIDLAKRRCIRCEPTPGWVTNGWGSLKRCCIDLEPPAACPHRLPEHPAAFALTDVATKRVPCLR